MNTEAITTTQAAAEAAYDQLEAAAPAAVTERAAENQRLTALAERLAQIGAAQ